MLHGRITSTIAALLVAGAIAPGVAGARPDVNIRASTPAAVTAADTGAVNAVPVVRVEAPASTGFDWGDAAIGGGVIAALALLLGGGAVLLAQRRQGAPSGGVVTS